MKRVEDTVKNIKVEEKIIKKEHIMAWLLLSVSIAFMLTFFAPIEAYYSNKNEFWFSIWQLLGTTGITFIIVLALFMIISCVLNRMRLSVYYYAFLIVFYFYLYIQGNYIPRDYGVLNGVDIQWDEYVSYGIASIVVALICLMIFCVVVLKFRSYIFKIGTFLSLFILCIQIITISILMVQSVATSSLSTNDSIVVTDNKMLNLSKDQNIIVFILDTYDASYLNYLLEEGYESYSDVFMDFTYYSDTLGAYPTTKASLPYILTGIWYENEQPFTDYVNNAYINNNIYKSFKENNYSVGIYTSGMYLSSNVDIENVEKGKYKIAQISKFIGKLYKIVAFNYAPHQLKRYFYINTDEFSDLKTSENYRAYSMDVQEFAKKLTEEGIAVSEKTNCFRVYHLAGTHPPYTFGKNLISDDEKTYSAYDEAAGNCMMLKKYFDELRNKEIYNHATIVVMADHGNTGYSQNPIFLIKNSEENHDFKVSNEAMSYEYLPNIWIALANGKFIDENFISNCKKVRESRRFLSYYWDDLWDREYLPTMKEMIANGVAGDIDNLIFSGIQYEPRSEEHLYLLGTQLSFIAEESTANYYCIYGFGMHGKEGTWTYDNKAVMEFKIQEEDYSNLKLTLECEPSHSQQNVFIYANNLKVAEVKFAGLEKKSIIIPKECVKNDSVRITIEFPVVDENSFDQRLNMRSIKLESTDEDFDLNNQRIGKYNIGTPLLFSKIENSVSEYCIDGFSWAEDEYTWTDSNTAEMKFFILNKELGDITLEYRCAPFNGKQHVILYANDHKIADYDLVTEETKAISIPIEYIADGSLDLRFELPDATVTPKELGMNEDVRTLGLAMKELIIKASE